MRDSLLARLEAAGQEHLLQFWDELDDEGRRRLAEQIEQIDLPRIAELAGGDTAGPDWAELAARAEPPPAYRPRVPGRDTIGSDKAKARGEAALRAGQLGLILVAGGQGTRLGFDHPKGMFRLGPVSNRCLFQILIEQLLAVRRRYQVSIPLYLMTSPATHDETVEYLERHERFGLPADDLRIFCQGTMPAVDAESGKILLAQKDSLFLSPDGHGGMLQALDRSGCLEDARQRGISHLFYGQIDNPLLQICDPELIGYHLIAQSEMTSQVVQKVGPDERVGNLVLLDGRVQIIEYSDLPLEVASQEQPDGTLRLWAGSIAVHVFDMAFLEKTARSSGGLPFHLARKKCPYIDPQGRTVDPAEPNAIKFERFIFDLLPLAERAIAVEAERDEAFAPVKNAEGGDSPATARAAMVARHRRWLEVAGVEVAPGVAVEISPLYAMDVTELIQKLPAGLKIVDPTFLN